MVVGSQDFVKGIIGGEIKLNLFGAGLAIQLPQNLAQLLISIVIILPYVILIASLIMILIGAINWVKSNGNEKELEKAQKTIKNAIVGFIFMFVIFIVSNFISYLFIGLSISDTFFALAPCGSVGNVIDQYNKNVTTGIFNPTNMYTNPNYLSNNPNAGVTYTRESIYEAFQYCSKNLTK
ncbi:MAG: hypothetical protein WCO33_02785 [bacterium]